MKITVRRTVCVEMTEEEAREMATAVRAVAAALSHLPEEDRKFLAEHSGRLLQFSTELFTVPR